MPMVNTCPNCGSKAARIDAKDQFQTTHAGSGAAGLPSTLYSQLAGSNRSRWLDNGKSFRCTCTRTAKSAYARIRA
eukprot:4092004-Amphidinium_carterae.1